MIRKFTILFILLMLSVAATQAQTAEISYNPLVLEHDGLERTAHIYEPDGDINAIMIALHGFYSSARAMEAISDLNTIADERGWVIVYPEAADVYWDDGRVEAGLPPVNEVIDDVGYLAMLSDTMRETYAVDDVYLSGLALGGTMAIRAACETPEKYKGIAVVNALMWSYQTQYCENTENPAQVKMLFLIGSEDHIYWVNGRTFENFDLDIMSAQSTSAFWSAHNGCGEYENTEVPDSELQIAANCADNNTIAFLPVHNGGNNWSGTENDILNRTGINTAQLVAAFFADDENWQEHTVQENASTDAARSYALYVPTSYDPSTPTPVVLSLHGRTVNNFHQASASGFNAVAEEHGFIVVYPMAFDLFYDDPERADAVWNYTGLIPNFPGPHDENDDEFLDAIVDDLAHTLNVDMNRLYVNGLSNGGYMVNHLACTRSDRYAAFASMAANAAYGVQFECDMDNNTGAPILFYHGTDDIISPWDGAPGQGPGGQQIYVLAPMTNTFDFWLDYNHCEKVYEQRALDSTDYDSNMIYVQYTGCPDTGALELYIVVGGGHVWHGVNDFDNTLLGEVNMDVNASEAIWEFYSRYTLDGRDDSNSADWSVPGEEAISGEGLPQIPMTLAEMTGSVQESPELQAVAALQTGGLTLYFSLDFAEDFDCDTDTVDEVLLAEAEGYAQALRQMSLRISDVSALNNCQSIAAGELFVANDPLAIIETEGLASTLIDRHQPGTTAIVVGNSAVITELLQQEIPASTSLIIQPDGRNFNPIAIVPLEQWSLLADSYRAAAGLD